MTTKTTYSVIHTGKLRSLGRWSGPGLTQEQAAADLEQLQRTQGRGAGEVVSDAADDRTTIEPVTADGWYAHTDGTVGKYTWRDGCPRLDHVADDWDAAANWDFRESACEGDRFCLRTSDGYDDSQEFNDWDAAKKALDALEIDDGGWAEIWNITTRQAASVRRAG